MKSQSFFELFETQRKLDQRIEDQHQLQNEPLFNKKVLAFLVELGELANETRCFKFWSVKPPADKAVILEEYVDGLHFILSLGLELGFTDFSVDDADSVDHHRVVDQFQIVFDTMTAFHHHQTKDHYEDLFREFLILGYTLHFSLDEIIHAYYEKNKINHHRQNTNY